MKKLTTPHDMDSALSSAKKCLDSNNLQGAWGWFDTLQIAHQRLEWLADRARYTDSIDQLRACIWEVTHHPEDPYE